MKRGTSGLTTPYHSQVARRGCCWKVRSLSNGFASIVPRWIITIEFGSGEVSRAQASSINSSAPVDFKHLQLQENARGDKKNVPAFACRSSADALRSQQQLLMSVIPRGMSGYVSLEPVQQVVRKLRIAARKATRRFCCNTQKKNRTMLEEPQDIKQNVLT